MNETNKNTAWNAPVQEPEELEIDLLDLMATLMLKWKTILALLLVGALLGCGVAFLKGSRTEQPVTDEAVAEARSLVATDKAVMVDQLFFQYVSYKEYQDDMRAYYGTLATGKVDQDNVVQMRSEYYMDSTLKNLDTVFTRTAMTEADYQAMRDIAPDEQAGAAIYDRVLFTTVYNNSGVNVSLEEGRDNACLINVELYGASEEQCQQLMAVVDAAFQKKADELKATDSTLVLESLGTQFNHNVEAYVENLRKTNIDRMTTADAEMTALTNKVNALSSEEKEYYNLLKKRYEEPNKVQKKRVSWLKFTVIGAFLGAVAAASVLCLIYLFDGTLKTDGELERGCVLLSRVSVKGKKNLFGTLAALITRADQVEPAEKAEMLAADLGIVMEKNGKTALVLMCSNAEEDTLSLAEQVKEKMRGTHGGVTVSVCDPLHSVAEREAVAKADLAVVLVELKKSKRAGFQEWRKICARYRVPLAGAVAVQKCW